MPPSQARRPAFGCRDQRLERAVGQPHPDCLQQRPRLLEREAKVLAPDLGELPLHTQAVQPQPQIVACQQHESQLRRRGPEQQLHLADGVVGLELVQVVDHQPERLPERAQIFERPSDDVRAVQMRGGRQLRSRSDPAPVWRSESRTESQNTCGSCSWRGAGHRCCGSTRSTTTNAAAR